MAHNTLRLSISAFYINGYRQSMSAKDDCFENAQAEGLLFALQTGTYRRRHLCIGRTGAVRNLQLH
ncbi:MAG TPA: hypothetical protein VK308_08590 [Pyrinomonadaceae bacterium]|nr:hypothetical protein [Pyrinomonadaceae bacterium]